MTTDPHPDVAALHADEITALRDTLRFIAHHCRLVPTGDTSPAMVDRYAAVLRRAFPPESPRLARVPTGLAIVRPVAG